MTTNEIISKWRGECRHISAPIHYCEDGKKYLWSNAIACTTCDNTGYRWFMGQRWTDALVWIEDKNDQREDERMECEGVLTEYTTDPSAWTPELYQEIDNDSLVNMFISFLADNIPNCPSVHSEVCLVKKFAFIFTCSTPLQKATALAKTITESR